MRPVPPAAVRARTALSARMRRFAVSRARVRGSPSPHPGGNGVRSPNPRPPDSHRTNSPAVTHPAGCNEVPTGSSRASGSNFADTEVLQISALSVHPTEVYQE